MLLRIPSNRSTDAQIDEGAEAEDSLGTSEEIIASFTAPELSIRLTSVRISALANSSERLDSKTMQELRQKLIRQKTRADRGTAISGTLTSAGLYYMAGATAVSAYSYGKSANTLEALENTLAENGIRLRARDKLSSFLVATTETVIIKCLALGYDDKIVMDVNIDSTNDFADFPQSGPADFDQTQHVRVAAGSVSAELDFKSDDMLIRAEQ